MDKTGKQTYVLNVERKKKIIFFTLSKRERKKQKQKSKINRTIFACLHKNASY